MTGPLTLKRRFLEENIGPTNSSFQKLQFLDISNFGNFDRLLPFLNKVLPQETNFSTVPVSGESMKVNSGKILQIHKKACHF